MFRNVVAVRREGRNISVLSILFEVPDEMFDLLAAVKAAVSDYCKTPEGRAIYSFNYGCFDWGDFAAVPNEFCEKHGFRRVENVLPDEAVEWEELLVEDFEDEEGE